MGLIKFMKDFKRGVEKGYRDAEEKRRLEAEKFQKMRSESFQQTRVERQRLMNITMTTGILKEYNRPRQPGCILGHNNQLLESAIKQDNVSLIKNIVLGGNFTPDELDSYFDIIQNPEVAMFFVGAGAHKNMNNLKGPYDGKKAAAINKLVKVNSARGDVVNNPMPIHLAAAYGNHLAFAVLADRKSEIIGVYNDFSWTPAHYAAFYGHIDVIQKLLDTSKIHYDSYAALPDMFGRTPLMLALGRGMVAVARELIEMGGNLSAVDRYGHNAFQFAQQSTLLTNVAKNELCNLIALHI